jgi:hypothetical protein
MHERVHRQLLVAWNSVTDVTVLISRKTIDTRSIAL